MMGHVDVKRDAWPRVKLGDVCEICPGTRVRRKDSQGGKYPVYGGGGATFTWPEYNREDQLIVSRFAMSEECVRFVKGRFFLNDSGLSVSSADTRLLQQYLDWCLYGKQSEIYALGRGAAQKNLDMEQFPNISFPLPPLAVQREIVARLEKELGAVEALKAKFEALADAAEAEFKAALKETFDGLGAENGTAQGSGTAQRSGTHGTYETHGTKLPCPVALKGEPAVASVPCRMSLIGPMSPCELPSQPIPCRCVKLGDVCENLDYKRVPITKADRKSGDYPYYGASGIVDHVANYIFDGSYLLVSEDGANLVARSMPIAFSVAGKIWVNNHAHVLSFTEATTQVFVEHFFAATDISDLITGAAQPKLTQKALNDILLPLPPLATQREIVARLDAAKERRDKLVAASKRGVEVATLWRKAILKEAFA